MFCHAARARIDFHAFHFSTPISFLPRASIQLDAFFVSSFLHRLDYRLPYRRRLISPRRRRRSCSRLPFSATLDGTRCLIRLPYHYAIGSSARCRQVFIYALRTAAAPWRQRQRHHDYCATPPRHFTRRMPTRARHANQARAARARARHYYR